MSWPREKRIFAERAFTRRATLAVEVLDTVSLSRLSRGLVVTAQGLKTKPLVNSSGLFVWIDEPTDGLQRITIDPGLLPYSKTIVDVADVKLPPLATTVELTPTSGYLFASGSTGLRGTLIERRIAAPIEPIPDAEVRLRWLQDDGTWRDAPIRSLTDAHGDFATALRPTPTDDPRQETNGALTVRVLVTRGSLAPRISGELKLPPGRVAEPSTYPNGTNVLTFAWDELQLAP